MERYQVDEMDLDEEEVGENENEEEEEGEVENEKEEEDEEEDGDEEEEEEEEEEDDEDDFNVTLRTPARLRIHKGARARREEREPSPSPIRKGQLFSIEETSSSGAKTEKETSTGLSVPGPRARTNSNYTLSSTRASRTSSEAGSLTTASGASSLRALSREPSMLSGAPSLTSRTSSGRASDVSDTSSIAGVKRPRSAVDKGIPSRTVKRSSDRSVLREPSEEQKRAGKARVPSIRDSSVTRAPKAGTANTTPALKVTRPKLNPADVDAYDTLDSTDDASVLDRDVSATKRRKVKAGAARLERTGSALEQIPEERPATGRR
ncbi:hypothetical protein DFH11DRAFT_692976 [Phellopilus nigrolimitatus]|nr:hypothetical protein DFH11DRAFT_692976 [Phellopilus nigrolimitatus]